METSLKKKVAKGTFWVFVSQIVTQFFAFVKIIIIARILSPDDFGLFGIALIVLSLFEVFTRTGFDAALIQRKDDIKDYLDTAFVVNIFRGILLFILLFFSAPFISMFFENDAIIPIIRVVSFTFLINGYINPGTIYFRKELDFRKQFHWDMSRTITNVVVSLSIVFYLRNVWVLVIAGLSSCFIRLIVSYMLHPFRPKFTFRKQYASSLFQFGKWILGSSILVFLLGQGDDIFVGKLLGTTALGFYQLAYRISNMPATEYSHLIATVMFPAYSKLQDNLLKLKVTYLKVLQLTALLSIPIAGLIFALAPDFTKIFLGEKWMPMVPAMQVLALYGMLRAIGATTGVVFMAVGRPEIRTKIQSAQLILLAIIIYPLTMRWGILGASIAVTAYALVFNLVAVYKVLGIVQSEYKEPLRLVIFPLAGALVMILTILILKTLIFSNVAFTHFLLLIATGTFTYLLIAHLFDRFLNYGSKQLMEEQFVALLQKSKR